MPVAVSAVLDHDTVQQLLAELLPMTIDLGEGKDPGAPAAGKDRWIKVDPPQLVELVPGRGIRIQTSAQINWTVAGVGIPFTIHAVRFLLMPQVAPEQGRVNLHITLEDADLKNVPRLLENGLISQINTRLQQRRDAIGWHFAKTLALRLALPKAMDPLERFVMDAGTMKVEVDATALRVGLELPMHLVRRAG